MITTLPYVHTHTLTHIWTHIQADARVQVHIHKDIHKGTVTTVFTVYSNSNKD